jgi:D-alanyl-D-alanine carboxypeptidase-like protein
VPPLSDMRSPYMPARARALDDNERQFEILQASSAPGISRHHWGTDFDLFDSDMNPELWTVGDHLLINTGGWYVMPQDMALFNHLLPPPHI